MGEIKDEFSVKLNRLFEEKRKPDGAQYSQSDVIEGTKGVLTRVYLWKLRSGRAANPGYQIINAIADFFGVAPSYFFESNEKGEELIGKAQENDLIDQIALRSSQLEKDDKQAVLFMIDSILKSKGMDRPK